MDLEVVELSPSSEAERDALTALVDLGQLIDASPVAIEDTRLIGGQMVDLHVVRHRLGAHYRRMTADTDFGLDLLSLRALGAIPRFASHDYQLREGHRFYRKLDDQQPEREALIDVLIPSYTSRAGRNKPVDDMLCYQTPGLAELLQALARFYPGDATQVVTRTIALCSAIVGV